jgi:hypothetical protein
LGQVTGRCGATTPAPNVAEKNRTKGVSPTAVFRSPSRQQAAMQLQSCYMPVLLFLYIYIILDFTLPYNIYFAILLFYEQH